MSTLKTEESCPKCGEFRLLTRHRTYIYCDVCSHRWGK